MSRDWKADREFLRRIYADGESPEWVRWKPEALEGWPKALEEIARCQARIARLEEALVKVRGAALATAGQWTPETNAWLFKWVEHADKILNPES